MLFGIVKSAFNKSLDPDLKSALIELGKSAIKKKSELQYVPIYKAIY